MIIYICILRLSSWKLFYSGMRIFYNGYTFSAKLLFDVARWRRPATINKELQLKLSSSSFREASITSLFSNMAQHIKCAPFILISILVSIEASYNPFSDNILFSISWPGPINLDTPDTAVSLLSLTHLRHYIIWRFHEWCCMHIVCTLLPKN